MRRLLAAVIATTCMNVLMQFAAGQQTEPATKEADAFVPTPRKTALGTVFLVRPAFGDAIAKVVDEVRTRVRSQRQEGKNTCYISIPMSSVGGGYSRVNVEIARFIKQQLEKRYGENAFWALAPGQELSKLPSIDGQRPGGGEYMYMWTQILGGEDGKGSDFDMVYFVGPGDMRSFFKVDDEAILDHLDSYVTERAQTDPAFNTDIASNPINRKAFVRYYGLRASATFSKGCHDEWNIFMLVNRRRDISDQVAVYFDGREITPAEGETRISGAHDQSQSP